MTGILRGPQIQAASLLTVSSFNFPLASCYAITAFLLFSFIPMLRRILIRCRSPFILFGTRQPRRACVMFRSSTSLFHSPTNFYILVLFSAPRGSFVPSKAIRGTWHAPEKTADVESLFASATETFDNVGIRRVLKA